MILSKDNVKVLNVRGKRRGIIWIICFLIVVSGLIVSVIWDIVGMFLVMLCGCSLSLVGIVTSFTSTYFCTRCMSYVDNKHDDYECFDEMKRKINE